MKTYKQSVVLVLVVVPVIFFSAGAYSAEQPVAIFHAFNQKFSDVANFVCILAEQGYSHVQISPAQKSNPGSNWWDRYQPVDYGVIEGLGSEADLKKLADKAHGCGVKVIADVVFNHMANLDGKAGFEDVAKFQINAPADYKTPSTASPIKRLCEIQPQDYSDGNREKELGCWLGGLPDLNFTANVKTAHKAHIKKLLNLGVDGFRFDAAKHMPAEVVEDYIDYVNRESQGKTWNYLEVIEDHDTQAEHYSWIAAVEDFMLYNAMKTAFSFGGDLRALPAASLSDKRSVTFGRNHDTIKELNQYAINPYSDATDSYLATAYVLARMDGTPLIFNDDNLNAAFIPYGVKFRKTMVEREKQGLDTREFILRVIANPAILLMERGGEGFFVLNKGKDKFDIPVLDLTLTNLEGCYRELRNNFTVAVERRDGKKYVTRWASPSRGGLEVYGRDALYFVREPLEQCKG